jgi:hypothetical protein
MVQIVRNNMHCYHFNLNVSAVCCLLTGEGHVLIPLAATLARSL